ncbi:MAG: pur operon repressor [Bacillota bacterium]|nr:pur operon repressor [Bacillota bacterium]REJ33387.1 MAG: pur operon repressor [Bacillota bacterium]
MVKMLLDEPGALVPLGRFADALGAAKSTISEDLALVRDTFQQLGLGVVETVAGAAGGVRYHPRLSAERMRELLEGLSRTLSSADRLLPGGFVYMTDIVFSPRWSARIGEAFATVFAEAGAQAVVTVETKGIPLAMATARSLNLPLVVCRRDSRVTEGTAVSITYVSGSSRQISTMSLARRAMSPGSRVLLIDDFLKGGGTARGMADLMAEFEAEPVGMGVLVATREPRQRLIGGFVPLVWLEAADEAARVVRVVPNEALLDPDGHRPEGGWRP